MSKPVFQMQGWTDEARGSRVYRGHVTVILASNEGLRWLDDYALGWRQHVDITTYEAQTHIDLIHMTAVDRSVNVVREVHLQIAHKIVERLMESLPVEIGPAERPVMFPSLEKHAAALVEKKRAQT